MSLDDSDQILGPKPTRMLLLSPTRRTIARPSCVGVAKNKMMTMLAITLVQ
jgi:hypothetical protein